MALAEVVAFDCVALTNAKRILLILTMQVILGDIECLRMK